jgi:UDP-N-acetylmuramyl pentapeptide phosphotransferase/UDP-N-acetylglucosamine-1-phosphate transferase
VNEPCNCDAFTSVVVVVDDDDAVIALLLLLFIAVRCINGIIDMYADIDAKKRSLLQAMTHEEK